MEATNIAAENRSIDSSRGDARISIAKKWANRRRLQENQQRLGGDNIDMPFSIPPLCVLLRRSWNQTINSLVQHQQNNNSNNNYDYKTQRTDRGSPLQQQTPISNSRYLSTSVKHESNNKRIPFPSVLSVLKANAVKLQVETIMLAEENEKSKGGNDGNGIDSALNVLPANCNDFTTSAVNHMSDSRSRAFLLLDFSAIVQTHTVWRKRLGIPTMHHKDVQIVYSARHNCNARLLELLQRLGVGLKVATKYDLAAVREMTRSNHDGKNAIIWDDTSILVKPDSFYRNLLFRHNPKENQGESASKSSIPITVGDAEEMERIHKQLHKICKRRRQRQYNLPKLDFILKLDNATDAFKNWKAVLQKTLIKVSELPHTNVVGVALELGGKDEAKTNTSDTADTSSAIIGKIDVILLLDALSNLVDNWVDEVSMSKTLGINTATTTTQLNPRLPQVHLTNPITATEIESGVVEWIEQHRKLCNGITIDLSRLLMANAAALCTRIIGVKNNESNPPKSGDNSNSYNSKNALDSENDGTTSSVGDIIQHGQNEAIVIQQHLYIDDGCYGSLSNYPNEGIPLPLKSRRLMRSLSATSKELVEREIKRLVNTTVWGPTCDGLDKVCSNVTLPRLCRDDWLVFADLGFCNEGTCFNGFSPPDIACCVLGGNQ